METLAEVFGGFYTYFDTVAFLALSAIGLIIIFGMMGIINMAHGELMMTGAYITSFSFYAGIPWPIAMILGAIGTSIVGIILERLIIRRFYGQLLSSLVVTWGLSLVLSQAALLIFGPIIRNVATPFGSFEIEQLSFSYFRVFMFLVAIALIVGLWVLFAFTKWGVRARGTMENPQMAHALGIDTSRIYTLTFGLGSMLAGLAGGFLALTATLGPFVGLDYTPQAFVTVVVGGGAEIFTGLLSSVLSLSAVKTLFANQPFGMEEFNIVFGRVAMLVLAFIIIRMMPAGISDWIEKRQKRVREGARRAS